MDKKMGTSKSDQQNKNRATPIHDTAGGEMPDVSRERKTPDKSEVESVMVRSPQDKQQK